MTGKKEHFFRLSFETRVLLFGGYAMQISSPPSASKGFFSVTKTRRQTCLEDQLFVVQFFLVSPSQIGRAHV